MFPSSMDDRFLPQPARPRAIAFSHSFCAHRGQKISLFFSTPGLFPQKIRHSRYWAIVPSPNVRNELLPVTVTAQDALLQFVRLNRCGMTCAGRRSSAPAAWGPAG
jgi:hypothetical protein